LSPRSYTVLVVDDDTSIRFLCRVNLELDGCTVLEAASLAGARVELARGDIDVVLLDVHLGSESGLDLLAEIKRDRPGLPVAMLTGSVGGPAIDGARADALISKPFTLEELTRTVRDLASRTQPGAG
jgi:DNA-binding response OmpR family regulator